MTARHAPLNVCGIVVHANPDRVEAVVEAIRTLPGVDIHGEVDGGRLIVTAIDTEGALAVDQLTAMHRIPGVVAAALAYHEVDEAAAEDPAVSPEASVPSHPRRA